MSQRIQITPKNANEYFYFQPFTLSEICGNFNCGMPEYNDYLFHDALRSIG
jgi:hypothetical protein